jgi:large subunit ribosomal protein L25
MAEELNVELRSELGTNRVRRLRRAGKVPAVLYGHGRENIPLTVAKEQIESLLRHGSRLVTLTGALNESAFIREAQWDTYGTSILHLDLTRISLHEKVEVNVPVGLRGEAPGVREGGMVEQLVHSLGIDCPAGSIPEKIWANINNLVLNGSIKARELALPEGASLLGDPEAIVVQCVVPAEMPEVLPTEPGPAEPEVIGAKKAEEEEEE